MENILSCGLCNTKFPNFDNFRTHMKEHLVQSQQKKNLSAVKSNLQVPSRLLNPNHKTIISLRKPIRKIRKKKRKAGGRIKKEEVEGEYACQFCEKVFKYLPLLHKHEKIHNQEKMNDYCSKCNSRFINSRALEIHKSNCLTSFHSLFYQCPACPLNFVTEEKRNEHERIQHARLRCPNCTLCFYDRSFVSHLKSCKASNESLANSGGEGVHTFIVSANVKGLLESSDKQANYAVVSEEVMKHLQLEGKSVETLYLCKNCNHAFKSVDQLENHQEHCSPSEIKSSTHTIHKNQDNEDELIYATEASDNVECDTVGEEVVLDQDGFQEMEVNLQDSPDLNYLVTSSDCSEDTTYVVCLDNNQTSEEGHQENAGIEEEGEESADQQLIGGNNKRSSIISPAAAAADRVSSIITVAGHPTNMLAAVSQSQRIITSSGGQTGHNVTSSRSHTTGGSVITTAGRNIITIGKQPTTIITSAGQAGANLLTPTVEADNQFTSDSQADTILPDSGGPSSQIIVTREPHVMQTIRNTTLANIHLNS